MSKKVVSLLKMVVLSLGLIGVVALMGHGKKQQSSPEHNAGSSYDFAMGTSISVNIYTDNKDIDKEAVKDAVIGEIKLLDETLISWRNSTSELGKLNSSYTVAEPYVLSPELMNVLQQSLKLCIDSEGALDITIRPLAALWNIEGDSTREFIPPSKEDIDRCLEKVDYNSLQLLSETYSPEPGEQMVDGIKTDTNYYATLTKENMIIDLGATGKGYALDKAREALEEAKVDGALITVGGSILVYGEKSDKSSWRVGVRDPNRPNDTAAMMGYIEFPAGTVTCVSTSGGYEKYKTYEGRNYHHILDSKTGYPAKTELLSVTVVCNNGLVSDGLSTACFVLGYERSLPLLEKYNAEAVFMDLDGNIMVTEGLQDMWIEQ